MRISVWQGKDFAVDGAASFHDVVHRVLSVLVSCEWRRAFGVPVLGVRVVECVR